jgi:integrase
MRASLRLRYDIKPDEDGKYPVYIFYYNGDFKRNEEKRSCEVYIYPADWIGEKNKNNLLSPKSKTPKAAEINLLLKKIKQEANEIILQAQLSKKSLSHKDFWAELFGEKVEIITKRCFYEYTEYVIREKKKEGKAQNTLRWYSSMNKQIKERLGEKTPLYLEDVDAHFLYKIQKMMLHQQYENSTINKTIKTIKAVVNYALDEKDIEGEPFKELKLRSLKEKQDTDKYLLNEDIERLFAYYLLDTMLIASRREVLRQFLFSCNTGLAHVDINNLRWSHIEDGKLIAFRQKTNDEYCVPLTPMATKLLGYPPPDKDVLVFTATSNQMANRYLKEINVEIKTRRVLTFHLARHTFGTLCAFFDIDQMSIMSMMGHTQQKTSQKYVKIVEQKLKNDISKKWGKT